MEEADVERLIRRYMLDIERCERRAIDVLDNYIAYKKKYTAAVILGTTYPRRITRLYIKKEAYRRIAAARGLLDEEEQDEQKQGGRDRMHPHGDQTKP